MEKNSDAYDINILQNIIYTYYLPTLSRYKIYALEKDWTRKNCQGYYVMMIG